MNQPKDTIIIGGGIIGVCAAYYLAKQGRSVTLIEKDDIGAGSSYGNAGLIVNGFTIPLPAPGVPRQGLKCLLDSTSYFSIKPRLNLDLLSWLLKFRGACNARQVRRSIPILLALGQGSLDLFDELHAQEAVDFGYQGKGRLILFTSQESFEDYGAEVALMREFGVEASLLDAEGVRRMEPSVSKAVTNGIFCTAYAHLEPVRFVDEMARLAQEQGARIKTGTEVSGFETTGQRISAVITTDDAFSPEQVVLAGGAWSPVIANHLKLRLPIQPAKGYSLSYKKPPRGPQLPLALTECKVAVTPMGDTLRFSSTFELAGYDPSINQRRLAALRASANEYLSGMDKLEDEVAWSGFRPATPDDLPIIERNGKYDNLILATGHGTLGVTHGLITGKLVSQIIVGEPPWVDLTHLSADRF